MPPKDEPPGELAPGLVTPLGAFSAKLSTARNAPTEQRVKASKTRELKMPDWEVGFFRMFPERTLGSDWLSERNVRLGWNGLVNSAIDRRSRRSESKKICKIFKSTPQVVRTSG